jgi:hypothetical protein
MMAQYRHIKDGVYEVKRFGVCTGHIHPCEYEIMDDVIQGYVFVALDGTYGKPESLLTSVQAKIDRNLGDPCHDIDEIKLAQVVARL